MAFQITGGKIETAKKVVVYGPEGIGKSTLAAQFPGAVFIDTEGSTDALDVLRLPKPTSFAMLKEEVVAVRDKQVPCQTIVIDTADWAERMCLQDLLARHKKSGIEDFGYGKGYTYLGEDWAKFLNLLEEVKQRGVNVVLNAHAAVRKFEQPDEMGSYDRWELKMSKQSVPITKEWADMILFANYQTFVVKEKSDANKGKVQGGKRVMYTEHHPCWDAKNRYQLPSMLPFAFAEIAHLFGAKAPLAAPATQTASPAPAPVASHHPLDNPDVIEVSAPDAGAPLKAQLVKNGVPEKLATLMALNNISEEMIQHTVGNVKGIFPADMPIRDYDPGFIEGCLIGAWEKVAAQTKENWSGDLPF